MPDVAKLKKKAAEFELKKQFDKALAVYVEILDGYDKLSDEANAKSAEKIHPHHRWELAMTIFQIAISLASITILTRMRWLYFASGLAGAAGVGLAAAAWLHI